MRPLATLTFLVGLLGLSAPGLAAPELGSVAWKRDLKAAQAEAKRSKRPLLILFDEVPGCQTCQRYGQSVLSHPLIVEAVETLFVPIAVFNNLGGADAAALKRFNEPSWNNPVVRIVDANLKALSPRVSGDYSQFGLLNAMTGALRKSGHEIPGYLTLLQQELNPSPSATAHYAMYCFWTGEVCLGQLPGVRATRAGFADGHEVVQVRYDSKVTNRSALDRAAAACGKTLATREFSGSSKDDKYQLKHSQWRSVPMTDMQKTRVNARLARAQDPRAILSSGQIEFFTKASAQKSRLDLSTQSDLRAAFKQARQALR